LSGIPTHDTSNQSAKTHASDRTATVTGDTTFREYHIYSIQLEVDGTLLSETCEVAEAFAKHFVTVYKNCHFGNFPSLLQISEFL
jgi:hypothetical protein